MDRNAAARSPARALALMLGATMRCHVAYTKSGSSGFAVMVSLSLKKLACVSRLITTGFFQLAPPSVERDASTALSTFESLMPRVICCTTPLGENDTHGSVARS